MKKRESKDRLIESELELEGRDDDEDSLGSEQRRKHFIEKTRKFFFVYLITDDSQVRKFLWFDQRRRRKLEIQKEILGIDKSGS